MKNEVKKRRRNREADRDEKPAPDVSINQGTRLPLNSVMELQRNVGNRAVNELLGSDSSQRNLRISEPGEPEEIEADRLSREVAEGVDAKAGHAPAGSGGTAGEVENTAVAPAANLGPGQEMDAAVRATMEAHFGHDFSGVRIHNDSCAAASARAMDAHAYTLGKDVVFNAGEYAPQTKRGKQLLAHELTHVVQNQKSGKSDSQSSARPATIKRDSLVGKASSFFSEKTQVAGKWLDEKKWAAYRALIAGMKQSKNTAIGHMRALVPKLASSLQGPANTIIDVVDFIIDMIDALALAIIGLAVGFVEGIAGLIMGLIKLALGLIKLVVDALVALLGKPDEFHKDLDDLAVAVKGIPPGLKKVVDEWLERYKRAPLEEQVLMGGELVGQIEAFIATFAFAGTKAGQAGSLTVRAESTGTRVLAAAGVGALREAPAVATSTAVVPKVAAQATVVTSQAMMMSSGPGSGGGAGSSSTQAAAGEESEEARLQKKYADRSETTYPANEWKRIEQLEERYPKLKSARLRPVRRPTTGDEAIFEERMQTTQSPYSLAGYSAGDQVVQFDGISPDGFVEEIKIQQSMDKVDDIVARLRYQQGFARDYGLKGVEYSIKPPSVASEVERRVAEEHLSNVYRARGQ